MGQNFIPLSVPHLNGRELEYITHAIETGWVSSGGPYVEQFEDAISKYVKVKGAVSVQNGTSGLHIALKVCGVEENDEVIVPSLTFIAAVNPVKYVGAEPIFMDCDDSLCLDARKLLDFCNNECTFENGKLINKKTKKHVKALIVVHIFGNMADMVNILDVASKFNLKVIEDATEALGTFYTEGQFSGKHAGTLGDVGVYSFNGNKIITTGGGGMIVSHHENYLKKAKHLTTQAKSDDLYYTHDEIGYNYRLTNLQAAIGLAQLEQIEDFIEIKQKNYHLYKEKINEISGLSILEFNENIRSNYWFYALCVDQKYPMGRDELMNDLISKGIQVRPIWGLIHEQKPYVKNQAYKIEKAKIYLNRILNIPCGSSLSQKDVEYVTDCLKKEV